MADSSGKNWKDSDLLAALVNQAVGYRDRVPLFHIVTPSRERSLARARGLLSVIWPFFGGDCGLITTEVGAIDRVRLPNEGSLSVFHPSGALAAVMHSPETRKPIAHDERKVDRKPLLEQAAKIAGMIAEQDVGKDDKLQFESKWERKAWGITVPHDKSRGGEKTAVALFEVLSAFRRYLHGLPVLGRASVHVSIGAQSSVIRWGIDWRPVRSEPFAHTEVINPKEGAQRVMDDLWWRRPERPFTLKDFEPRSFQLGYLAHSRRQEQFVMQPAWVAILAPSGTTMGQVVAVPAAPRAFEPIARPAKMPRASVSLER
jgi:hypothetical protein